MKKKILLVAVMLSMVFAMVGCEETNSSDEIDESNQNQENVENNVEEVEESEGEDEAVEATSSATVDGVTSASIVPEELIKEYKPKGFTDSNSKKALFIVADPRKYSVNYDLATTAMKHFEDKGVEVELRDLYDMNFNPVLTIDNFYYAKDGSGEATPEIKKEQELVKKANHIIFCYPNWHDTPIAIVKGYMETVFAKQFAYQDTDKGLEGMLSGRSIYTIMNAGFLGGGRGYIGDGVGIDDEAWNEYMNAFKVMDDDTAGFWGVENKGRFVNDRTPKNDSDNYEEELNKLREDLIKKLNQDFFN